MKLTIVAGTVLVLGVAAGVGLARSMPQLRPAAVVRVVPSPSPSPVYVASASPYPSASPVPVVVTVTPTRSRVEWLAYCRTIGLEAYPTDNSTGMFSQYVQGYLAQDEVAATDQCLRAHGQPPAG